MRKMIVTVVESREIKVVLGQVLRNLKQSIQHHEIFRGHTGDWGIGNDKTEENHKVIYRQIK